MNKPDPERFNAPVPARFPWLAALVDAALVVDSAGTLVACNHAALQLFEFSADELLKLNLGALYPEEFAQGDLDSEYIALMQAGEIIRQEVILQKKSGSQFPAKISIVRFTQDDPDTRYLVQIENLSSQKIVEASRILKQKAAEAESRRKMDFLSVMSHEIRTPLHGMSGALALLERFVVPDGRRVFDLVQSSLQSLFRILDDVLLNASLELDQLTLQNAPFSIYQLGDELLSLYRHVAAVSHNDLLLRVAADVPLQLTGDGGRIRQIIANYLMNALKFTQQGLVWMDVRYDAQKGLQVSISDNGQGIGVEARKKLFEMFGQGDAVTRSAYAGTGLGLAICKRLAERMGGQVGFLSDPGMGSSFWFSVPLASAKAPPVRPVLAQRTVMLAADRHADRWQGQLEEWGAAVVAPAQGSAAPCDLMVVVQQERAPLPDSVLQALQMGTPVLVVGEASLPPLPASRVRVVANLFDLRAIWDAVAQLLGVEPAFGDDRVAVAATQPRAESVRRKVLLAEDSRPNAEIFGTLLREHGYRVELAADGLQAIEAFKRFSPDLILMDIQMPVCDGYEAARAIRLFEAERGLAPVQMFALTADVATAEARESSSVLFNQILCKPITIADLVRRIESGSPSSAEAGLPVSTTELPDLSPAALDTGFLQRQFARLRSSVVLSMTDIFQNEARQRLDRCQLALQQEGGQALALQEIQQQAHALKSSAAGLGLLRLADLAKTLERQAKADDLSAVRSTLDQALAAFEPDLASLRDYLHTHFSAGAAR